MDLITAVGVTWGKWPCQDRWTRCVRSLMLQGLHFMLLSASKDYACFTSHSNIPTILHHIYFFFLHFEEFFNTFKGPWTLKFNVQSPTWALQLEFCLKMWKYGFWFPVTRLLISWLSLVTICLKLLWGLDHPTMLPFLFEINILCQWS